jgi:nitrogen regulatory protein PII
MKLITAIIRQEKLEDVTRAVIGAGARGMTLTEVRGFGQQYGWVPGEPDEVEFLALPKLRVDLVVQDWASEKVADAIAKAGSTGSMGDGKVWVCPVESALRLRTGERDLDAI